MDTREIIHLHVGQCGVQVGTAFWELYAHEHHLNPWDGSPLPDPPPSDPDDAVPSIFFSEATSGKMSPRALILDTEPTVVDEVRTCNLRRLFRPDCLISGNESTGSNFIRGAYTMGREFADGAIDQIRKLADDCESLQGFIVTYSVGGGTGAGLGGRILEMLHALYGQKIKMGFPVYPSPRISTSVVEPYNAVLSTGTLLDDLDLCCLLDNKALYDICVDCLDIWGPRYLNLNRIIAQVASSITAPMRFSNPFHSTLADIRSNLVPDESTHFLLSSFAPLEPNTLSTYQPRSVSELTASAFHPRSMMAKCDPRKGCYMAVTIGFRGSIVPKDVGIALCRLKTDPSIRFVDWNPAFRCGLTYQPCCRVPCSDLPKFDRCVTMLGNSTSVRELFARVARKFDLMYYKRAFVHWYVGEGLSEGFFLEERERLESLVRDYKEIEESVHSEDVAEEEGE